MISAGLALLMLPPAAASAGRRPDAALQDVIVRPGDTLWGISNKYLKDPARWDEILRYNALPASDPTVALPGMTLRVPVLLIKAELRAARLVYAVNRVLYRRKDTAGWTGSRALMDLYQGDFLRTLDDARARVKFLDKELLSLEPNSMAVIRPLERNADLELRAGSVFAGRARVTTESARVTPRTADTRYATSVEADLTTKVEVYRGLAAVDAQGSRVDVPAGMQTRVRVGLAPEAPRPLEDLPGLEQRAREFAAASAAGGGAAVVRAAAPPPEPEADAAALRGDVEALHVGVPIMGYHIQASRERDFSRLIFDRRYESDERFTPADIVLPAGAYWWRIAVIDLLNVEGRFSEPRYYSVGLKRASRAGGEDLARSVRLLSPVEGALVHGDSVLVSGIMRDDGLTLSVGGGPVRVDADGNFLATVLLRDGVNEIVLVVSDGKGNSAQISRRVTR